MIPKSIWNCRQRTKTRQVWANSIKFSRLRTRPSHWRLPWWHPLPEGSVGRRITAMSIMLCHRLSGLSRGVRWRRNSSKTLVIKLHPASKWISSWVQFLVIKIRDNKTLSCIKPCLKLLFQNPTLRILTETHRHCQPANKWLTCSRKLGFFLSK